MPIRIPIPVILAVALSLAGSDAPAETRLVGVTYTTIQSAIDDARNGDTVLVPEGTYYENIRFNGKAIIVASRYLVTGDTSVIARTIINGSMPSHPDSGSVVSFINGEDTNSVLCGFTITGGSGTMYMAAVLLAPDQGESGGSPVRVTGTASPLALWVRGGGGVYCSSSGAKLVRNVITQNRVVGATAEGGGIEAVHLGLPGPVVVLERNRITDNYVRGDSTEGFAYCGGASFWGVTARVVGNAVERNRVIGRNFAVGGGLGVTGVVSTGVLSGGTIAGNIIRENGVTSQLRGAVGAGIILEETGVVLVEGNLVERNTGASAYAWAEGGGLCVTDERTMDYGRKIIVGNRFLNNQLERGGGSYMSGAGIFLFLTSATVDGNEIGGNSCNGFGGGIAAYTSAFSIQNNLITRNVSYGYGGGVDVYNPPLYGAEQVVINNTFTGNRTAYYGGGMSVRNLARVVALNNIFWGDAAAADPEIAWSNALVFVFYNDIQGGWMSGTGNIDKNPEFVPNSLMLSDASPCIGAGREILDVDGRTWVAPSRCFGGSHRPTPLKSNPDLGACENRYAIPLTGVAEEAGAVPETWTLAQNYPNPFNPSTTIRFGLPQKGEATLAVYNTLGEIVARLVDADLEAGWHEVRFDASGLSSGVYFFRLKAGEFTESKRMLLLK